MTPKKQLRDGVSVRLTPEDRAALSQIRAAVRWLRTDSDAIRYALTVAVDVLKEIGAGKRRRIP